MTTKPSSTKPLELQNSKERPLRVWFKELMLELKLARDITLPTERIEFFLKSLMDIKFDRQIATQWIIRGDWRGRRTLELGDFTPPRDKIESLGMEYWGAEQINKQQAQYSTVKSALESEQAAHQETWNLYLEACGMTPEQNRAAIKAGVEEVLKNLKLGGSVSDSKIENKRLHDEIEHWKRLYKQEKEKNREKYDVSP